MAEENKRYSNLLPIKYKLDDPDYNLKLNIPAKFATQQGMTFLSYAFLQNVNDVKTKNYTLNYLTSPQTEENLFSFKCPCNLKDSIITTLQFSLSSDRYLNLVSNNADPSNVSFSTKSLSSNQNFVIDFFNSDGLPLCQIWTYDGLYKKYLIQKIKLEDYILVFDTVEETDPRSFFNIVKGEQEILLSIYSGRILELDDDEPFDGKQYIVGPNIFNGDLVLSAIGIPTIDIYRDAAAGIQNTSINTDYTKLSNNFVYYLSGETVDINKTLSGQQYNFIAYNNYESNTLSANEIVGALNYFNLKNQVSNNHNINKNLPHITPQEQRIYTSILNNETEEISQENLKLNYNFYTAEYKFQPDKYTKFILPESLQPFNYININDSGIQQSGSYGAQSPYFSDRIYKPLLTSINQNEKNGTFLCTWLHDNGKEGRWYDRYYIPSNISELSASRGNLNQPFEYISEIETILNTRTSQNIDYYDVSSSLIFEPQATYFYTRIGNKYVNTIIDQIKNKIKQNFNEISIINKNISPTADTLIFNSLSYDTFKIGTEPDFKNSGFNLSFNLHTPSLEKFKGYQIIGNNYNTGISLAKNFYYTPFIYLQQDNTIFFYDTDFNLIKSTTIPGISSIKDICYISQSNDLTIFGMNETGGKLMRVNISGDIIRENNSLVAQELIAGNPISRIFYGIGSKATFKNAISAWDMDIQTLTIEPTTAAIAGGESILRRLDNTVTSTMSGLRGVNINDTLGAALSGHNQIIFKDFKTNLTFVALSANEKIWDINAFDEKLYVQVGNKLKVYNTEREILSTFNLTTSAVSGYKIDFISEDYNVKPIVLSRGADFNLLVDKIDIFTLDEKFKITTYSLNISSVDLGYNFNNNPGVFISPTNLYSANQTFKKFENKICLVTKLDNQFAVQPEIRNWDETDSLWNTLSADIWSFKYTTANPVLTENSSITEIPNIRDNTSNHISVNADLLGGSISVYVNGDKAISRSISSGIKPLKDYLYNNFLIGAPNYSENDVMEYVNKQHFLAKNGTIQNLNVYAQVLNVDLIKYEYLRNIKIDPITFDILSATRNNIETVNNLFSYKIPGSLSNRIKIYIKNGKLKQFDANLIAEKLTQLISAYLPMNITVIDYDFTIGNLIDQIIEVPVDGGLFIGGDTPGGAIGDQPPAQRTDIEDGSFEPEFNYKLSEDIDSEDGPDETKYISTEDGKYIYLLA
jgi:hypothetical protein